MILEISFMQFELKHSIPVLKRKSVLFKKTKQKKKQFVGGCHLELSCIYIYLYIYPVDKVTN